MNQAGESSMFYNPETASYCYIGVNRPNHDVVIVGWDDKYPKVILMLNWKQMELLSV